jgi:hypothetical protein
MSCTYRHRGQRHEYLDFVPMFSDTRLKGGTTSNCALSLGRRIFDNRLRTLNFNQLRRSYDDPGYDPAFQARQADTQRRHE